MNRSEILTEVKALLAECGDVDPTRVDEQTAFIADLALDSLVLVRMTVLAEERFEVRIPDEAAWELHTVGAVVNYIEHYIEETRAGRNGAHGE